MSRPLVAEGISATLSPNGRHIVIRLHDSEDSVVAMVLMDPASAEFVQERISAALPACHDAHASRVIN